MGTGVLGDHGDNVLVPVVEVFSLPIVIAITQHLEIMVGTAQENGQSIAPVTSCPVLPMVCFPLVSINEIIRHGNSYIQYKCNFFQSNSVCICSEINLIEVNGT